ncbi:MAG: ribonuclease D [Gammaproteobacteria bacterium]|nr:ribonuclease D [Gammaproteobacteria bacterium]
MTIDYIDTQDAFEACCQQFQHSRFLCIDTEFHRETTYYPELALIQLGDEQHSACIDPLALQDFQPLLALFRNPNITKVFHAAGQDLEIFHHDFGCLPDPIFDTQIAATLLGYGEQIGYAALVKTCLDVELDKSQTRTDWMKRPLSDKQLEYAANDVRYLAQLFPDMEQKLQQLGRLDWLAEDFALLSETQNYQVDMNTIWRKAKGHQRLRGQQLAILQQLASWRETTAIARNRPRRRILPDDALIDLAIQKPNEPNKIRALRSLGKFRINDDDLRQLVECINRGLAIDKQNWPQLPKKFKLNPHQDALVDTLQALLKLNALQHNINPSSLANRKQLEALVTGERDLELLKGWRKLHGGQQLLEFLDGKLSLSSQQGKLVIQ